MNSEPLVSVVVPTFNQGPFIGECLESLSTQTYATLEIIVQDSRSTDSTKETVSQFQQRDSRIQYYREQDSGQSDAINRGLLRSNGRLWTWLCSDDRLSQKNAMRDLVHTFRSAQNQSREVLGVFGDAQYIHEDSSHWGPYETVKRDLVKADFQLRWPLSQPASLLAIEYVQRAGGVDESLKLNMDLDLFLRLLDRGKKLRYCDSIVADVRLQNDSKSVKWERESAANCLALIRKHFGSIGNPYRSAYAKLWGSTVTRSFFAQDSVKNNPSSGLYHLRSAAASIVGGTAAMLGTIPRGS